MNQYKVINPYKKNKNWFYNSNHNAILLIFSVYLLTLVSDNCIKNNQLIITLTITTIVSFFITLLTIPNLKTFKIKQIIRKEGPKKHLKKEGTPTSGGILIIPIGIIGAILANLPKFNFNQILSISLITILFMLIGVADDYLSIINKQNTGLKPKKKLILQIISGIVFLYFAYLGNWITPNINLWFNENINLNYFIWPLGLFVLIAESNSTNLTDGLDGLASGCSALIFTGMALHLTIQNDETNIALAKFCISMAGACLGFLLLNKNPAKIFMGDSGSLALGASLGSVALLSNNLWALLIMGGVFLAESISVIIQVGIFKITKRLQGTGKKVFLMTPIHHHFELKGIQEHIIVRNFWIITLLLIILSFFL